MGRDTLQFVNTITDEDINKIYKAYDEHRYDHLLKVGHKILTLQQKRIFLITFIEHYINKEDRDEDGDVDERTLLLTKIVAERNVQHLISTIINDQFYQEPLYGFIA